MSKNRLGRETSPYLLQHKDNPVHWWPWGPEALSEGKRMEKPILLSIGYAACHWCHVMAHESFEDEPTAAVMNELYVNIKVDREERPDIDAVYMGALLRMGESGGWPLTMFLDSDGRPFWGGTYFPKSARWGKPAFVDVLRSVARAYREQSASVQHNADLLTEMLGSRTAPSERIVAGDALVAELTQKLTEAIDPVHGGLKGAPKFPQWNVLWLLWRGGIRFDYTPAREAVARTLTHICQGGIYDHLAGGFARYSTDERWLAPHFEKMLYDNALLVDLMTEVWRETRDPLLERRVAETVDWLEREMIAEGGGFAASLDADSEGEEGKFYVWSAEEIADVLGEDADVFCRVYDVAPGGNWEGKTILNRLHSLELLSDVEEARLAELRGRLLARRAGRVRPGWDDKVLADWNGLMIAALARASRIFHQPRWLELVETAFAFITKSMSDGARLKHSYRAGRANAPATLSDYANMVWAALRLHQATGRATYLDQAILWTDVLDRHYWLAEGGYAMTADDTRDVIARLRSGQDDATPNGNAVMVSNLVALTVLTGEAHHAERAGDLLEALSGDMAQGIVAHCGLLAASIDLTSPMSVIIAAGAVETDKLAEALDGVSLPGALEYVVQADAGLGAVPGLAGKDTIGGRAAAYVCTGPQCSAPVTDATELARMLKGSRGVSRRGMA